TLSRQDRGLLAVDLAGALLEESRQHLTRKERSRISQMSRMMKDPAGKAFITAMTDGAFRSHDPKLSIGYLQSLIDHVGAPQFFDLPERLLFRLLSLCGHFFPSPCTALLVHILRKETASVILPGEEIALQKHLQKRTHDGVRINLNRLGEAILGEAEVKKRMDQCLRDLQNPFVEMISIKISTLFSQINMVAYEETLNILKERLRILYRASTKTHINLDMEEYKDLHLTCDLFMSVLDEPEFLSLSSGLALQSYLPDSFEIQKKITEWATQRINRGGAPVRIRIVKGANLGMERVEASIKNWPQAPYSLKKQTDANFKRMLEYGMQHTDAVHIGCASHNLFDISYGLLLRSEFNREGEVGFEMLEGMANHLTKTIQTASNNLLLYCPAAKKEEFHTAMAYLMRRLDEQTAKENFLPHFFDLQQASDTWNEQVSDFLDSLTLDPSTHPARTQNRNEPSAITSGPFQNEADTDWSLPQNQQWARSIVTTWQNKSLQQLQNTTKEEIERALSAKHELSVQQLIQRFRSLANLLRQHRQDLIGTMMAESHKIMMEADSEVSEAIDMCEYYANICYDNKDILYATSKNAIVITPWNFPCSIPTSGILAAFAAGYNVLFKPAPEAKQSGKLLYELCNKADLPLHLIVVPDEPEGTFLITHPLVDTIILTGSTATARFFLKKRPTRKLFAETGGKNSMIVTPLADRDLACRDSIQSAFGYSGQKCSALSLLICVEEVYYDPQFRAQLKDAAENLFLGSVFDLRTKVNPLIGPPSPHLLRALTTLEEGETWLCRPEQHPSDPNLWSPGIKLGVKPTSFMHQTELFGPILGVMCAKNLDDAIKIANVTAYGLTAGLHSLDRREHAHWIENIQAGNLYINRGITGAIVGRQPFGGTKASSFGIGMKAGGPNYILQFLNNSLKKQSYKEAWDNYFTHPHPICPLVGEDNILFYRPHKKIFFFHQEGDMKEDIASLLEAATITGTTLIDSRSMTTTQFNQQIKETPFARVRCLTKPPEALAAIWAETCSIIDISPPNPDGRIELLHFVREISLSYDYHRYGSRIKNRQECYFIV
ncbi:MAG TPA: bifunctional proline dehydrogenase/L-glutamate gamma-semialdehyde dehydrogenase, partial [Chlamydiales bacterium]|nr:bifunctional proline dehydrogenase/L-glutamate gamma-semialdehyde dehydrogenase [Chlamydiales bacterium]